MSIRERFFWIVSSALICMTPAIGWEYEQAVPLPSPVGLVSKKLDAKLVTVDLDGETIKLKYIFSNSDDHSLANNFSIYLPVFHWDGVASENGDKHFPELTISSDGRRLNVKSHKIALHNGRDVTSEVRRAKLDPVLVGALGEGAVVACQKTNNPKYRQLVSEGALYEGGGCLLPFWHAQVNYSWMQKYKALGDTDLTIQHKARPGFLPIERKDPMLVSYLTAHCGSAELLDRVLPKLVGEDEYLLLHFYKIPFKIGGTSIMDAVLNFSPFNEKTTPKPLVSFVCTGHSDDAVKVGSPTLRNINLQDVNGVLSVLVISRQQ